MNNENHPKQWLSAILKGRFDGSFVFSYGSLKVLLLIYNLIIETVPIRLFLPPPTLKFNPSHISHTTAL